MKCKICGSSAINPHMHQRGSSDLDLCDVCYWRVRAQGESYEGKYKKVGKIIGEIIMSMPANLGDIEDWTIEIMDVFAIPGSET
jgi:ribosome-binding protein aMBF1 (putative translation factor)